MGKIKFTKMEGIGNDYIYINLFEEQVEDVPELAVEMSHRRYGIGSDGLVLIGPSQIADLKMDMYNSDGSQSEMCGNAIRCVGKYAWDNNLVQKTKITVETGAGIRELTLHPDAHAEVESVTVDMGEPILEGTEIPSLIDQNMVVDQLFEFDDFSLNATLVSMGNPHFVTFVESVEHAPVEEWGKIIENDPRFPNRINVEFVEVISPTEVKQRTWERGAGETWACGTGASAVAVAGILTGRTKSKILNHLTGGDLTLSWKGDGESVFMKGPADVVFTGEWEV